MADAIPTPCPATRQAFEAALRDLSRAADAQRAIAAATSAASAAILAAQIATQRAF